MMLLLGYVSSGTTAGTIGAFIVFGFIFAIVGNAWAYRFGGDPLDPKPCVRRVRRWWEGAEARCDTHGSPLRDCEYWRPARFAALKEAR
jgi:hypothetical protein